MPTLTHEDILDLVTTTQKNLGPMKWTEIATDLTHYEVLSKMMKKDKVKFFTGNGIQRNLMIDDSGAAHHTSMYATDNVNVDDVMTTFTVPFRHSTTNYAFDRREKEINGGPEQIVDLIKVRRADAMISLAKLMENTFWSKPEDSSDELTPWGIMYWLVYNATTGFNGGNPSGFTGGAGGVDSSTYTRWRNWTAQYTTADKTDLIKKMRKCHRQTDFVSPTDIPSYRGSVGQNWRIYVNEDTIEAMEDIGESTNENLGRDLAPYDGKMAFKSSPIIYVPKLNDLSTSDPIVMMNWNVFDIFFLKGEHLREDGPLRSPTQHTVYNNHVDLSWNTCCLNRRRLGLIAKSDWNDG